MFEWIEHHIGIGVSKFFMYVLHVLLFNMSHTPLRYDNNSKKPIASLVQRYIEQGFVKVINVTYVSNPGKKEYYQAIVYNQALRAHWDQYVVCGRVAHPHLTTAPLQGGLVGIL